jgi:hypothetical protein
MEESELDNSEDSWKTLLTVFQLIAERGRRIRLAQKTTTVDNSPLARDKSTAADQPPAQTADTF